MQTIRTSFIASRARVLLFPSLCAGGLLMLCAPVQAGDYKITYRYNVESDSNQNTSGRPYTSSGESPYNNSVAVNPRQTQPGAKAWGKVKGSWTLVFTWTPSNPSDVELPPEKRAYLINIVAGGGWVDGMGAPSSGQAGGTATVPNGKPTTVFSYPLNGGTSYGKDIVARKLVNLDNPKRDKTKFEFGPYQGESSFWVQAATPRGAALASANAEVNVARDTRSVSLSRAGAHDEWVKDGVRHGDTTYSYEQAPPPGPVEEPYTFHKNTQTFIASVDGGWDTDSQGRKGNSHSWSPTGTTWFPEATTWSPQPATDTWSTSSQAIDWGQLHQGNNQKWYGSATGPSEKTITYTVTGNDEAKAEARYVLHIHDPVEKIRAETNGLSIDVDYFDSNGQPVIDSQNPIDGGGYSTTHVEGRAWSIVGTVGTEMFGVPLGIEVGTETSTSNEETKSAGSSPVVLGPNEYVVLQKRLHYNRHHVEFWKYNVNGKEKRWMSPPGPGQPDPGVPIEIPQETIWTRFNTWEFVWSGKKRRDEGGTPTPATPQPTLPPPSFKYSKKEGKNVKSAL